MNFCASTANIWQILGYVVVIFKIVIPLILIVLGMVDLGKAVVASKDDAINKAVSALLKRFIAAVVIFFVPTIVSAIFNALSLMSDAERTDYNICVQCVTNVGSCDLSGVIGSTTTNNNNKPTGGGGNNNWVNQTQ